MKTLLVAGGSGGHLMPALTLAEDLRKEGACFLLTTRRPVEEMVMGGSSLDWVTVDLRPFTPVWRWFSPAFTGNQLRAIRGIWRVIRQHQPDVVIGFGGYLSAIGVTAARLAGLPTVVHEQNLLPGRANRLLARWADAVAVSFPETRRHLPRRARVEVTGNPIRLASPIRPFGNGSGSRNELDPRTHFGFDADRPVLLVMGGSQGSRAINALATRMWIERSSENRRKVQVIHLAGSSEASAVEQEYRRLGVEARVFAFLHEIQLAYRAATLAIGRAGATTIAEMVEFQLPAVLIPYPHAGGHQRANADWMQEIGGAIVFEEKGLTADLLLKQVQQLLLDPDRLARMRAALHARAGSSAGDRLEILVKKVASR